jgi:hypothetical protein
MMIIIHLIIFVILIHDITTANSSTNRFILVTSCQVDNNEVKSSKGLIIR